MGFQIGGAVLDFVVLGILNRADEYGYLLTQQVREILDVSESALYPALKRLQKAQLLQTYDQAFLGRNRRYYQITAEGRLTLQKYAEDWGQFKAAIDILLEGEQV